MNYLPLSPKVIVLGAILLSSCAVVGPDYTAHDPAVSERFLTGVAKDIGDVSKDSWWNDFRDPRLTSYVEHGLETNLSLRSALARIEQADAIVRQNGRISQVNGAVSGSVLRSGGKNLPTTSTERYSVSGTYVFDLFGGVKRGAEQSLAQLEAAGFSAGDARLAFLSSLVGNYIVARFNQTAATLTRRSIKLRRRTLELVESQFEEGAATQLDVIRARADFEATQAELPGYIAGFNASVFAIAALLNRPNSDVMKEMQIGARQPVAYSARAIGTPANLLRNVPAVRASERQFAASVAAIGIAEAQLLPSLEISGSIETGATDRWSFGPQLTIPVLNQPVLRAKRDQAIASAKEAELNWRSSVLSAVEQVEIVSSNLSNYRRSVSLLRNSVASQEQSLELSRVVYRNGALSLLDLIDTERATFALQISLAAARRDASNAWVQLQVATGRGWSTKRHN